MRSRTGSIQVNTIAIMVSIALIVTASAFWTLYRVILDSTEKQLEELVKSQSRLIESVAKFDAIHSGSDHDHLGKLYTLSQVKEAYRKYRGFGDTGEILLAENQDGRIYFLLPSRKADFEIPEPVDMESARNTPMYLALTGQSGIMQGRDFHGDEVLAAYEYLPFLEAGIVARIELDEIRYPFYNAAAISFVFAIISLLIGSLLQRRLVSPLVDEVFSVNKQLRQREEKLSSLSDQLSKYLSPQIYKSLFEGKANKGIFIKRKKLTVFFSDIVGFTSMTDTLEPEDLSALLNSYLNAMAELVIKHGGTLDQFIGDAVLVFFGDPESKGLKQDALNCVSMALDMRDTIDRLVKEWQSQGIVQDFSVRMGITTGFCTVGNFGSDNRMEYTIIGNQVNLASRFESHASPGEILISNETCLLVRDRFECAEVEPIEAKGFSKPVKAYRLIGERSKETAPHQVDVHGEGYRLSVDPGRVMHDDREKLRSLLSDLLRQLDK